ncbi:MAG: ABC transporter ATP-binding protein [Methylocystis sp.]|jgi:peptide/nickel transport system ATP-binding protein|nr:ABC transporter ATP-binding protein [Methylocystis sp.]MCA3585380.1 ABC transporter ATP-binding protein [Methylocystis sp.]MCA3588621.1 ABC transporter ATP-binding protein [Methylocystis sp.]MCA3591831.1 ABC transporter ATP-binding protein [Methylocystis sp.]
MTKPVLSIENLTVSLPSGGDRQNAVTGLSLTVNPGEIVCVVGESGSGKSVTAQAVMGLLPKRQLAVTEGRILLEGEDTVTAAPDRLRALRGTKMAMIFQEPMTALNPVMKVGDQIAEVLDIHTDLSGSAKDQKVMEIMEAVRLPDVAQLVNSYPHQLSGGQRQRVMIAQALILDPSLLIADEPTTALDVTTQAQILKLIREMQIRKGTGVLFITHDFGVVADIADRVAVMQHGRLVETGTAGEVLTNPQEPYTKMLIASVPTMTPPKREAKRGELALSTKALMKTFGAKSFFNPNARVVKAANDVNITVRRGETLGIVGESGSGKSTVARCVARLIDPTSGEIRIGDLDVATMPERLLRPHRKEIQIVFQDPYRSLNPRRTVGASIIEGPMNYGLGHADAVKRARDLMALVGLSPDALDRFPHQFSGGQRQRIAIARALAMEPKVLIADEAVSALDVSVQAQVLKLLDDVRIKFDLAVLFITHDLRVAAQICDRIAVMQKGIVVEQGATEAIFANPQHPYTKALFEAAPGRGFAFAGH